MGVLKGKVALVTGGGTGIGKAIAQRFYAEGASVAICGRRAEVLAAAVPEIGDDLSRVMHDSVDVTSAEQVVAFLAAVVDCFGGLDILVNNAGIMRFGALTEGGEQLWRDLLETNLLGPYRLMCEAVPHMRRRGGGSIVNLSSLAGSKSLPRAGVYCTSKAALNMMSQVAALEWAADNIRVNLIAPGLVEDTELADPIFGPDGVPDFYARLRDLHPLGRSGSPPDVAEAALFLASEQSSWITGVVLPLDGGRHLATNRPVL